MDLPTKNNGFTDKNRLTVRKRQKNAMFFHNRPLCLKTHPKILLKLTLGDKRGLKSIILKVKALSSTK